LGSIFVSLGVLRNFTSFVFFLYQNAGFIHFATVVRVVMGLFINRGPSNFLLFLAVLPSAVVAWVVEL